MKIWIDADNCSKKVMEIISRASVRLKIKAVFVADRDINITFSPFTEFIKVGRGDDSADLKILELAEEGDIVITADIPLAAEVLEKNTVVINPRGDLYTKQMIKERLSMRNYMSNLRDIGISTGSGKKSDNIKKFSEVFDRELTKSNKLSGDSLYEG